MTVSALLLKKVSLFFILFQYILYFKFTQKIALLACANFFFHFVAC